MEDGSGRSESIMRGGGGRVNGGNKGQCCSERGVALGGVSWRCRGERGG